MSVTSQHLMSDYDRMFYMAQAERIMMIKLMHEEKKTHPELEMPDMTYDFGSYPGEDHSSDTFKDCLNKLLKINNDIAFEVIPTPELIDKYKDREYLFIVIKWPVLSVITDPNERVRDVIIEAFNESTEWESIAAEWDANDRNVLLVDSMSSMDFSACLKNLFPMFALIRKYMQEGSK